MIKRINEKRNKKISRFFCETYLCCYREKSVVLPKSPSPEKKEIKENEVMYKEIETSVPIEK
jgi:hypothetical protein